MNKSMQNTTLCYIENRSRYLMLHRTKKQNDYNHDKWIGIGGKFEEGESPEDCVLREVREETGLELEKLEYRGIVTFVSDNNFTEFMHVFWSDCFRGNLIDCDEGELEWVEKSRMNDLPHWKGDEIFLDLLDKKVPFFSLKLVYENGVLQKAVLNGSVLSFQ
ncbi:MAG: 8-oxo-dGTP diphosphatase [Treponema sp.]|nr:8-oxo-dGTP diphosphatase [Treponema sp.]